MARSRTLKATARGRPAGGQTASVAVRLPADLVTTIDAWAAEHIWAGKHTVASRSEVVRRLVEMALAQSPRAKTAGGGVTAQQAAELAERQIDRIIDPTAPADERQARKRHILKGPREFRDIRRDRPRSR